MDIDSIVAAWRLAPELNEFGPPLEPGSLEAAERRLGRRMPTTLVDLYRAGNGFSVLAGNLALAPLGEAEGSVPRFAGDLRAWGWPIPPELLAFGTNGGGDVFGVWYPELADPEGRLPVVQVGQIFEPGCMAVVGTSMETFLLAWSGIYFATCEAPAIAMDAIALPGALRAPLEDGTIDPYFRWADPTFPVQEPDPYSNRLDADAVVAVLAGWPDGRSTP